MNLAILSAIGSATAEVQRASAGSLAWARRWSPASGRADSCPLRNLPAKQGCSRPCRAIARPRPCFPFGGPASLRAVWLQPSNSIQGFVRCRNVGALRPDIRRRRNSVGRKAPPTPLPPCLNQPRPAETRALHPKIPRPQFFLLKIFPGRNPPRWKIFPSRKYLRISSAAGEKCFSEEKAPAGGK